MTTTTKSTTQPSMASSSTPMMMMMMMLGAQGSRRQPKRHEILPLPTPGELRARLRLAAFRERDEKNARRKRGANSPSFFFTPFCWSVSFRTSFEKKNQNDQLFCFFLSLFFFTLFIKKNENRFLPSLRGDKKPAALSHKIHLSN